MTPKGSQRCRMDRRRSNEDHGWHPSRVLFRHEPFTGGVAWDRCPTLNHRLIAGKLPACMSRMQSHQCQQFEFYRMT